MNRAIPPERKAKLAAEYASLHPEDEPLPPLDQNEGEKGPSGRDHDILLPALIGLPEDIPTSTGLEGKLWRDLRRRAAHAARAERLVAEGQSSFSLAKGRAECSLLLDRLSVTLRGDEVCTSYSLNQSAPTSAFF